MHSQQRIILSCFVALAVPPSQSRVARPSRHITRSRLESPRTETTARIRQVRSTAYVIAHVPVGRLSLGPSRPELGEWFTPHGLAKLKPYLRLQISITHR